MWFKVVFLYQTSNASGYCLTTPPLWSGGHSSDLVEEGMVMELTRPPHIVKPNQLSR